MACNGCWPATTGTPIGSVHDDLRDDVVEHLGDPRAVLVVDETGFLKKGIKSAGVQRQYTGTAGKIANCQIGVFLTYASPRGHALIDRALPLWVLTRSRASSSQRSAPGKVTSGRGLHRLSAGAGSKGPRTYDWARVAIRPLREPGWSHWLLVRRRVADPTEMAYYVGFGPETTPLEALVRVAGTRWAIAQVFEEAKQAVGLDQYEGYAGGRGGTGNPLWPCWPTPSWL